MKRLVREGDLIPTGYGIAYRDFNMDMKVAYPLILHLVVRWVRDARFWLMSVGRPGYREEIEQAAYLMGCTEGNKSTCLARFEEGWHKGWDAASESMQKQLEQPRA